MSVAQTSATGSSSGAWTGRPSRGRSATSCHARSGRARPAQRHRPFGRPAAARGAGRALAIDPEICFSTSLCPISTRASARPAARDPRPPAPPRHHGDPCHPRPRGGDGHGGPDRHPRSGGSPRQAPLRRSTTGRRHRSSPISWAPTTRSPSMASSMAARSSCRRAPIICPHASPATFSDGAGAGGAGDAAAQGLFPGRGGDPAWRRGPAGPDGTPSRMPCCCAAGSWRELPGGVWRHVSGSAADVPGRRRRAPRARHGGSREAAGRDALSVPGRGRAAQGGGVPAACSRRAACR